MEKIARSWQLLETADVAILLAGSLMMVSKHSQTERRKLAMDFVSSVIVVDPKVESSDRRPSW